MQKELREDILGRLEETNTNIQQVYFIALDQYNPNE
jgi:hypothetical protein